MATYIPQESGRVPVNPIPGQAGVAAGAGDVDALTQRVTLADDDVLVDALGTTGSTSEWQQTVVTLLQNMTTQLLEALALLGEQDTLRRAGVPISGTVQVQGSLVPTALPPGASSADRQVSGGAPGAPSAEVQSVQGIEGMRALDIRSPDAVDLFQSILERLTCILEEQDALRKLGVPILGTVQVQGSVVPTTLPPGASVASRQVAGGVAGGPATEVQTVQGIEGMRALDVEAPGVLSVLQNIAEQLPLVFQDDTFRAKFPGGIAISAPQRAVIVSTTAVQLASSNVARKALVVTNNGSGTLYLGIDSSVTSSGVASGLAVTAGGSYSDSGFGMYIGPLWGIYSASASAQNVVVSDRS